MSWLFEESLPAVVAGVLAAGALILAWLHTGKRACAVAAGACIVLAIVVVLVERYVLTERELVDALLHHAARDVERNDLDALLARVHSEAPQIRAQAQAEFPRYRFDKVTIKSNLRITLDDPAHPQEAEARFNVSVTASEREGGLDYQRVPRYVIVRFRREKGEWKVYSYEHHAPQEGLLSRQAVPAQ